MLRFDLKPESQSRKILDRYLRKKRAGEHIPEKFSRSGWERAAYAKPDDERDPRRGHEEPDISEEDERILEEVWREIEQEEGEEERQQYKAQWDEQQHPRDESGQFSSKPGTALGSGTRTVAKGGKQKTWTPQPTEARGGSAGGKPHWPQPQPSPETDRPGQELIGETFGKYDPRRLKEMFAGGRLPRKADLVQVIGAGGVEKDRAAALFRDMGMDEINADDLAMDLSDDGASEISPGLFAVGAQQRFALLDVERAVSENLKAAEGATAVLLESDQSKRKLYAHRGPKRDKPWELHFFDERNEPLGHDFYETLEEAIRSSSGEKVPGLAWPEGDGSYRVTWTNTSGQKAPFAREGEVERFRRAYLVERYREATQPEDWTRFQGPRGGRGWRNTKTGEVAYQDARPGTAEGGRDPTGKFTEPAPEAEERPPRVKIQTRFGEFDLEAKKHRGMWFTRKAGRADLGWTAAGPDVGRQIEQQLAQGERPVEKPAAAPPAKQPERPTPERPPRPVKPQQPAYEPQATGEVAKLQAEIVRLRGELDRMKVERINMEAMRATSPERVDDPDYAIVPFKSLSVNPRRFQYKVQDIDPETGVTREFAETGEFSKMLGGMLYVWKDPEDGRTYVVNGHHRWEIGHRTGYSGNIAIFKLDAKNEKEARALGAVINIAEKNGTALDAARFIREMEMSGPEGLAYLKSFHVSTKGPIAAGALKMANLSDRAFAELSYGRLHPDHAEIIGETLAIPEDADENRRYAIWEAQNKVVKAVQGKAGHVSKEIVREMSRVASLAPSVSRQGSLFGGEEEEELLIAERGEVQAAVTGQLAKEVRRLGAVAVKGAAELVEQRGVGQVSGEKAREEREKVTNLLDLFNREIRYRGELGGRLNRILNDAAKEFRNARNDRQRNAIKSQTVASIRNILAESLRGSNGNGAQGLEGASSLSQPAPSPGQTTIFRRTGELERFRAAYHRAVERYQQRTRPEDWTMFRGERGGRGWRNARTGEIVYQEERPGVEGQPQEAPQTGKAPQRPQEAPQQPQGPQGPPGAAKPERAAGEPQGPKKPELAPAQGGGAAAREALGLGENAPTWKPQSAQFAKDPNGLFAQAKQTHPAFWAVLDHGKGVDGAIGAGVVAFDSKENYERNKHVVAGDSSRPWVVIGGLKGQERSVDKVQRKYRGNWSELTDIVRGTVIVGHESDFAGAVSAVRENAERNGWRVSAFEDGWTKANKAGYRDLKMSLESPDGHQCELQLTTHSMFVAKEVSSTSLGEGGHVLYERLRAMQEKADAEGRELTDEQKGVARELMAESQRLYHKHFQESQRAQPNVRRAAAASAAERQPARA